MDFRLSDDQEALRRGMRELLEARFDRATLRARVTASADSPAPARPDAGGAGAQGGNAGGAGARGGNAVGADARGRDTGGTDTGGVDGALADSGAPLGHALDLGLWKELGEAGLFALRLPEDAGGVGLGLPEAVLLFEEAGRALLPGPLVASHLAAGLVPGAADGSVVVTVFDAAAPTPVEHLSSAGRVLVVGTTVRALPPEALPARPLRSLDPLSPLHTLTGPYGPGGEAGLAGLAGAAGANEGGGAHGVKGRDGVSGMNGVDGVQGGQGVDEAPEGNRAGGERYGAGEALEADPVRLRREAALLTAAQQLGSAGRTLAMAVDHAREREQFGQAIGAFQAVKHLCARMLVRSETARSVVYAAAVTEDECDALAAKLLADEAAVENARDCLQVHGGMGFTWEADVHPHLKRAWLRAEQWRTAVTAEEELAEVL